MTTRILVDTGPLVALLHKEDRLHQWAKAQFALCHPPLWTCEAVLVEASHLLRRLPNGRQAPLRLVAAGLLLVDYAAAAEAAEVCALMDKYASVPMALADACLLRMLERSGGAAILTADSDFLLYRVGRKPVTLVGELPPVP